MKVYPFQQQGRTVLYHPSDLLVALRHGKIVINTLLRWCSAGLISSYILTVTAGIHFYNQLVLTSGWMSNLVPVLFVLLFTWLLYIQYKYSEKRTECFPVSDNDIKLNSFYIRDHYKINQKLIGIYMIATLVAWLIMTCLSVSGQYIATGFFMLSGLALYGFGLFMIRGLLKEKCTIRQMISKFEPSQHGL
jgi:hydrogenase-4 membrane subunit HyfE